MRIHHLAVRTDDVERLAGFYRDVVGLPVRKSESGRVWLSAGHAVVMLEASGPGEPRPDPSSMDLVAFEIVAEDRPACLARLGRAGIAIESTTEHTIYFRDPDGRRVALSSYPL